MCNSDDGKTIDLMEASSLWLQETPSQRRRRRKDLSDGKRAFLPGKKFPGSEAFRKISDDSSASTGTSSAASPVNWTEEYQQPFRQELCTFLFCLWSKE